MLGTRDGQKAIFSADNLDLQFVGEKTVYGFLARDWKQLFRDEEFANLYRPEGRPSTPPSKLAIAVFLQILHDLSDEALIEATRFDLRFKVALQLEHHEALCAKSTLQSFRARLLLHEKDEWVLRRTVELAKAAGVLKRKGKHLTVALDTTPVLGAGAVRDTINLLGDAIRRLLRAMAKAADRSLKRLAREHRLERFVDDEVSLKGEAGIDWADRAAVRGFVRELVADADRALELARKALATSIGEAHREAIRAAADLLGELLAQDIDRGGRDNNKGSGGSDRDTTASRDDRGSGNNAGTRDADASRAETSRAEAGRADAGDNGPTIRRGTARDRIVSTTDPEMRHGRKSSSVRFNGHKAAIAVDADSGVILDAQIRAGNDNDCSGALATIERIEAAHDVGVTRTVADCAYGDGLTRQQFADAGRELIAKVPTPATRENQLPKSEFAIDTLAGSVTCPAGQTTTHFTRTTIEQHGEPATARVYHFDAAACGACPLKARCCAGAHRTIRVHPQEDLLADARVAQDSAHTRKQLRKRQRAEHRIARLTQLGMRRSRYRGRRKTALQLRLTAALANVLLVLGLAAAGLVVGPISSESSLLPLAVCLLVFALLTRRRSDRPRPDFSEAAFRPSF